MLLVAVAFALWMRFEWRASRLGNRTQRPVPTLNERLLRYPLLWYVAFTAVLLAAGSLTTVYGRTVLADMQLLGMPATRWVSYYAVYESLVHFYADGFLWKMRRGPVRANI